MVHHIVVVDFDIIISYNIMIDQFLSCEPTLVNVEFWV